jgi:hypothetical protein
MGLFNDCAPAAGVFVVRAVLSGDFDAWSDADEDLPGVEPTGQVDNDVPYRSGQWGEKFRVRATSEAHAREILASALAGQADAVLERSEG